jgi:hypothetical protein
MEAGAVQVSASTAAILSSMSFMCLPLSYQVDCMLTSCLAKIEVEDLKFVEKEIRGRFSQALEHFQTR